MQRNVIGNQHRHTRDIRGRINGAHSGINILASRLGKFPFTINSTGNGGGIPAESGTQAGSLNENCPSWSTAMLARLSE